MIFALLEYRRVPLFIKAWQRRLTEDVNSKRNERYNRRV
jgi:hypothetical protein